jgi:hypothetical protein
MRHVQLFGVVVLVASLGACAAKAQEVRVEPELPALDPPPPPPRIITAFVEEEPEPPPVVAAPEKPAAPVRPPSRPARPDPRPEPERTDADKTTPPQLTLTPTPGTEVQTEAAIRDLLARAARDLSRVNTAALGADGRAQYDTAQRFLEQAEDALTVRNLVFAGKLADKAATLASVFVR